MSENVSGDVGDKLRCNYKKGAAEPRRSTERSFPFALAESRGRVEHGVALQTATRYSRPLQMLPL